MFAKALITGSVQGGIPPVDVEYLVIAGGGGGGGSDISLPTSGGGAGGYRSSVTGESSGGGASAESVLSAALNTAYTLTIGSGGSGGAAIRAGNGAQGSSSVFSTVTSIGGGYGAAYDNDGGSGGSGGGAGGSAATANKVAGSGTSGQGFDGGLGFESNTDDQQAGGGGGGAGQVGQNAASDIGGDGGNGVSSLITGIAAYRAGGGGGGDRDGGTYGSGGLGGGGDATSTNGSAGTVNTGGGGGAGSNGTGGNGGSGVVIIRIPSTHYAVFSAGVVYNYYPLDGLNVYEVTGAGVSDTVTFQAYEAIPVTIDDSLRFNDDDSAYLTRTPASAGDRQKFTWSGWIKRSNLNGSGGIMQLFDVSTGGTDECGIRFSSDAINAYDYTLGVFQWRKAAYNLLRDPSAWYHIHLEFDSTRTEASQRAKLYVNGIEVDYQYVVDPALNYQGSINTANAHYLGKWTGGTTRNFDGYMADVYFIDGQALDPSRFGKQDADGIWQPISYTGSYGTNGFHLDFADNSTAAALGTDTSGNGNDWTPSGITTDDQVTDTPSVNYATLNPLDVISTGGTYTFSDGNLKVNWSTSTSQVPLRGITMLPASGKWYHELYLQSESITSGGAGVYYKYYDAAGNNVQLLNLFGGPTNIYEGGSVVTTTSYTPTDMFAATIDNDANQVKFYINNTLVHTSTTLTGPITSVQLGAGTRSSGAFVANFGQRPFAYTPPTGFQALNSANLPAPTITDGKAHFQPVLYTGNGTSQTVRGLEFQPDFVWIKSRSSASWWHALFDAVRGAGLYLHTNNTNAEGGGGTSLLTSFVSNGFSLNMSPNGTVNNAGDTYVAWNWNAGGSTVTNTDGTVSAQVRANTTAGFSIATYNPGLTGAGQSCTVGHGLSQAPEIIITKSRSHVYNWWTFTTIIDGSVDYLALNLTTAKTDDSYGLAITSSTFTQNYAYTGVSTSHVAYCFHSVDGFSKIGSYTGNGSTDGPFVYTGFRPAFVIIKRTDTTGNWYAIDTKRDTYNPANKHLYPDLSNAEGISGHLIDFVSNGFKQRYYAGDLNASGGTYIYMAFAENPFKTARAR